MQAFSSFAQPFGELGLHKHMDILCRHIKFQNAALDVRQDTLQSLDNQLCFFRVNDILFPEHHRMGNASLNIVLIHDSVK